MWVDGEDSFVHSLCFLSGQLCIYSVYAWMLLKGHVCDAELVVWVVSWNEHQLSSDLSPACLLFLLWEDSWRFGWLNQMYKSIRQCRAMYMELNFTWNLWRSICNIILSEDYLFAYYKTSKQTAKQTLLRLNTPLSRVLLLPSKFWSRCKAHRLSLIDLFTPQLLCCSNFVHVPWLYVSIIKLSPSHNTSEEVGFDCSQRSHIGKVMMCRLFSRRICKCCPC